MGIAWYGPILLAVSALQTGAGDTQDARVEAVLNSPGYANGHWGLLVVDGKTGAVVYERNPDRMFAPASVTKLFSGAAALCELGPDYRFKTPVVRRGNLGPDGVLRGDLILVAGGDLSLGGRTGPDGSLLFEENDHSYAAGSSKATLVPSDPRAGLDHLARETKAAGVRSITGEVIVDDRLFESAPSTGSGPTRISPIVINDNVVDAVITPAAASGEPAKVVILPESASVSVDAQVVTAPEASSPTVEIEAAGPGRYVVRGRIPAGHRPLVKIHEVEDPAAFARSLFVEALRRQGVRVEASPLGPNPDAILPSRAEVATLPEVAVYTSPPFKESLRVILKVSQNLHASTLPLLIASRHGEATLAEGLRREGAILQGLGLDLGTISFGGGAGGARTDLVSPRATVTLLQAMARRPDFPAYEAALPVLGRDGTLAQAVSPDSPARGHARAKTGTYWLGNGLNGGSVLTSKALAGYMETSTGRPLVFAFFVNNVPLKGNDVSEATVAAGKLLGRLCETFYADGPATPPASGR